MDRCTGRLACSTAAGASAAGALTSEESRINVALAIAIATLRLAAAGPDMPLAELPGSAALEGAGD